MFAAAAMLAATAVPIAPVRMSARISARIVSAVRIEALLPPSGPVRVARDPATGAVLRLVEFQ